MVGRQCRCDGRGHRPAPRRPAGSVVRGRRALAGYAGRRSGSVLVDEIAAAAQGARCLATAEGWCLDTSRAAEADGLHSGVVRLRRRVASDWCQAPLALPGTVSCRSAPPQPQLTRPRVDYRVLAWIASEMSHGRDRSIQRTEIGPTLELFDTTMVGLSSDERPSCASRCSRTTWPTPTAPRLEPPDVDFHDALSPRLLPRQRHHGRHRQRPSSASPRTARHACRSTATTSTSTPRWRTWPRTRWTTVADLGADLADQDPASGDRHRRCRADGHV